MLALQNHAALPGGELEKNVARKQRLLEHDRLAAIFVRRREARQAGGEFFPLAKLQQFFLAARARVGDVPEKLAHTISLLFRVRESSPGVRLRRLFAFGCE